MKLSLALIQMRSTTNVIENFNVAEEMIRNAAHQGAQMISLPEVANLVQKNKDASKQASFTEDQDPFLDGCQKLAKELGVWIHLGSLVIKLKTDNRLANRAFMINDQGEIVARYDKIHMFDVDLEGGESYRESKSFRPGTEAVLVATPWGKIGLTICYDLRFPHLHRALAKAGAILIMNPAAFTQKTGEAHWNQLLSARAIENTIFVAAAAQSGHHEDGRDTYGHSLVVSPWGKIILDAGTEPGVYIAEIDINQVAESRAMVPSLSNERPFDRPEPIQL